jgi:hypothetical protein
MFSKKLHVDVKKSTLKIQDVKKDSATRFKHLKIVLGESLLGGRTTWSTADAAVQPRRRGDGERSGRFARAGINGEDQLEPYCNTYVIT